VNIQEMMKQAQQMQERLQRQMTELRVEGNAGGGMVTVIINGAKQVQSLTIDPEMLATLAALAEPPTRYWQTRSMLRWS